MAAGAAGAGHKKTRCLVDIHINVKASLCSAAMNQLKARQSRLIPQGAFTGVLVHAFKRPENFLRCSETWSRGEIRPMWRWEEPGGRREGQHPSMNSGRSQVRKTF